MNDYTPGNTPNPFIQYTEHKGYLVIPSFPRNKQYILRISDEANTLLQYIAQQYFSSESENKQLSQLLEAIGLGQLRVTLPPHIQDPESHITTEMCRQSGYEDGLQGNVNLFVQIYGKLGDDFNLSYLQGFLEGSYIRNKK